MSMMNTRHTRAEVAMQANSNAAAANSNGTADQSSSPAGPQKPVLTRQPVPFSPPKPGLERHHFFRLYQVFCNLTGQQYQESFVVRRHHIDVHELWAAVRQQGGFRTVCLRKLWATTARSFNHSRSWTNASYYFRTAYEQLGLQLMEEMLDAGSIPLDSIPLPVLPTGTHPQQQAFPGMELEQHPQLMLEPAQSSEYPTGPAELPPLVTMGHTYEAHSTGVDSCERLEQQQEQEHEQLLMVDWQHQQQFLMHEQLQQLQHQHQQQQQQQVGAEPDAMDSQTSGQVQQDQQQVQGTPHMHQAVPIGSAEDAAAAAAAEAAMAAAAAAAAVAAVNEGSILPVGGQLAAGVGGAATNPAANIPAEIEVYCGAVHGVFNTRRQRISCMCDACVASAGPHGLDMACIEFERHGGHAKYKKWKRSIIVKDTRRNLGMWLKQHGLEVLSQSARTKAARKAVHAKADAGLIMTDAAASPGLAAAAAAAAGASLGGGDHRQQEPLQQLQEMTAAGQLWLDAPPNNNLAGLYGPATHPAAAGPFPRPRNAAVAADSAPAAACAEAAAARPVAAGCAGTGRSGILQEVPLGEALVGRSVETWSDLDQHWFQARVEAYDPMSQLYLLQFADGELETLDLTEEKWRLLAAPSSQPSLPHQQQQQQQPQQQHLQQQVVASSALGAASSSDLLPVNQAPSPASSPLQPVSSVTDAITSLQNNGHMTSAADPSALGHPSGHAGADAAWLEAAELSLSERPLRVVFDSLTGCLRVLLASELLQAELHQQQHQQQQHQNQQQQHNQQQFEQHQEQVPWQAGTLHASHHTPGRSSNDRRSPGPVVPTGAAAPPAVAMSAQAPLPASPLTTTTTAAASDVAAAGPLQFHRSTSSHTTTATPLCSSSTSGSSLVAARPTMPPAAVAAAAWAPNPHAAAGRQTQLAEGPLQGSGLSRPPSSQPALPSEYPPQPLSDSLSLAQHSGPGAGGFALNPDPKPLAESVREVPVDVVCNSKRGTYLIKANGVICHCVSCVEQHAATGVLMAWSPPEFERHAGMGCNRKWRNSIKVTLSNNKRMSLGTWLVHFEQHRLQQQVRMQQDALILQQQQQQQAGLWQADMQPQQQLLLQTAGMDLLRPGQGADLPYHQAGYSSSGPAPLLHPALPQQQQQQQVSGSWLQASHVGAAAASAAAAAGSLVTGVPRSGGKDHLGYGCDLPAGLSGFVAAEGSTAQGQQVLQAAPWHQQQQQQQQQPPRGLMELPGMGPAASASGAEGLDVAGFGGMTAAAASPALAISGAAAGGAHDLLWAASGAGGSRKRPAEAAFGPSHDGMWELC